MFAASRSRLDYFRTIGSFAQERIRWNELLTGVYWESAFVQKYATPPYDRIGYLLQEWQNNERTQILSGIQFTTNFIEFIFVETKQLDGSNPRNPYVILTRQTFGQRSSMAARNKRRPLAFYFPIRICYVFSISKRRQQSDPGLCTTSVIVKRCRCALAKSDWKIFLTAIVVWSRHRATAFSLQVPMLYTDLDPTLLYILTLGTCSIFGARGKQRGCSPAAAVRTLQSAIVHTDRSAPFFKKKFLLFWVEPPLRAKPLNSEKEFGKNWARRKKYGLSWLNSIFSKNIALS